MAEKSSSLQKVYNNHKAPSLPQIAEEVQKFWSANRIFEQSVTRLEGAPQFNFYEGPPSANGKPGIHHVIARTVKDIFCRAKTLEGYQVKRKGGWDTHGLPVELEVEKQLGINKDDIGKKIAISAYNAQCQKTVMRYKAHWDKLTLKMGFWVDLDKPYITYEKDYIETLWWIIKQLYEKKRLYKGYSIQPYSPAAGTGLSSHELNMPGCYKEVKDISVVAQFEVTPDAASATLLAQCKEVRSPLYLLAWTTTPWTLPANTALAVGATIPYLLVATQNPYTHKPIAVVISKNAFARYFATTDGHTLEAGTKSDAIQKAKAGKISGWKILDEFTGRSLVGLRYAQLMPYTPPHGKTDNAFKVVAADFVATDEGTGIVHIAPTFGADDFKLAQQHSLPSITINEEGRQAPIVDRTGKFVPQVAAQLMEGIARYAIKTHRPLCERDFYVKNYTDEDESATNYKSIDVILSIILKEENKAFRVEKYTHTYPHCWRTNKPVLYYPLNAWFVQTTAAKDRMVELNKTINWKPASTGEGRFGNWLETLVDWNLSRSRYWGTPLPIWQTEDGQETLCIGSLKELKEEVEKASRKGIANPDIPWSDFDPHRPYVDKIVLASKTGQAMRREADLIDVWFDSGSMPYAQWHYPFENKEEFEKGFPADFIAEGIDQTRGWFFTLHAIAVMLFDSVAFKNVVANGLVLDRQGNKMSKSKGNIVDPFRIIGRYGPDATRWYMIENAPPWENLRFNEEGIAEVERRFFGTLCNAYSFFALYANIDGFVKHTSSPHAGASTYIDRWIISCLHSLVAEVRAAYCEYEPTRAARAIQQFVNDRLSNWYIRLNRKRFWQPVAASEAGRPTLTDDKKAAYETLYECLITVSQLMAPITPFFSEWLYRQLIAPIQQAADNKGRPPISVHLTHFADGDPSRLDKELETAMAYAQKICSLAHSLRKKHRIKVKTPLNKILLPAVDKRFVERVKNVEEIIKSEVNVKAIEHISDDAEIVVKKVRPNYKKLGKQYGARIKEVEAVIRALNKEEIAILEKGELAKGGFRLVSDDVLIYSEDIAGWSVATEDKVTVALDITITEASKKESLARDFVNRVQNLRKNMGLEVLDKIRIDVTAHDANVRAALAQFKKYICTETQALALEQKENLIGAAEIGIDGHTLYVKIEAR